MTHFEPTDAPPANMRSAYLDGLSEHQEYFLEQLVAGARTWCAPGCAYVVSDGQQIVEFWVEPDFSKQADALFAAARRATGAKRVLCKSFDTQMLGPAFASPARVTATAFLFRSHSHVSFKPMPDLTFRTASPEDLEPVATCDEDGFFEDRNEIAEHIKNGALCLLEQAGSIVGCGTQIRINRDRLAVDLGMMVVRRQRGRGLGSHVIAYMKDQVLKNGLVPVCGCAAHNIASRHALINAGFNADHRLLKIEYSDD